MAGNYAIIDMETGDIVHGKTYENIRDAKLALRYHFGNRTHRYGIGLIAEILIKLAWYIDDDDKWVEEGAE